jgi:glycosyltransferase involved in cell wall biosynthesis
MKVSLIVPTINRDKELKLLLQSIKEQTYPLSNIEIIIVDQNRDNRISNIIHPFKKSLNIIHKKVKFKGAAKARNFGVKFATGDIINFPDDDAFFEKKTLQNVVNILKEFKYIDALAIKVIDPKTRRPALLNFPETLLPKRVNCFNFYKTTIEFNTFWRKEVFLSLRGFNEKFGVGAEYHSEESADIILRALKSKYRIFYTSQTYMYHPDKRNPNPEKIYRYAYGLAKLFLIHKKNFCIYPYVISTLAKSIIGFIIYSIFWRNDYKRNKFTNRLKGFLKGLSSKI